MTLIYLLTWFKIFKTHLWIIQFTFLLKFTAFKTLLLLLFSKSANQSTPGWVANFHLPETLRSTYIARKNLDQFHLMSSLLVRATTESLAKGFYLTGISGSFKWSSSWSGTANKRDSKPHSLKRSPLFPGPQWPSFWCYCMYSNQLNKYSGVSKEEKESKKHDGTGVIRASAANRRTSERGVRILLTVRG